MPHVPVWSGRCMAYMGINVWPNSTNSCSLVDIHGHVQQWSSTFFGLPPTFNLVGSPPTSVCRSFFNQEIWFNLHVHVIRLDAKQSANGCATCTRCHHLWRYTLLSYGQWRREPGRAPGQHNSCPPPLPAYPSPAVCVCI